METEAVKRHKAYFDAMDAISRRVTELLSETSLVGTDVSVTALFDVWDCLYSIKIGEGYGERLDYACYIDKEEAPDVEKIARRCTEAFLARHQDLS